MGQITARLEGPTTAQPMCQGLGRCLHSCLAAPSAPRLPSGPSADGTAVPSAIPSISWGLLSSPPCPTFLAGNPSSLGAGGSVTSRTALPAPSPWAGIQPARRELLNPPNPAQTPVRGVPAAPRRSEPPPWLCWHRSQGPTAEQRLGTVPRAPLQPGGACSATAVAHQSPDL